MSNHAEHLFSCIISNPPYQSSVNSASGSVMNIFQDFQMYGEEHAGKVIMIYPFGRWFQRGGKGMKNFGKSHINNPHFTQVDSYLDSALVFSHVFIADGVCVVCVDASTECDTFLFDGKRVLRPGDRLLPLDSSYMELVDKIHRISDKLGLGRLSSRKKSRVLYGVESDFVHKNPHKVILMDSHPQPPREMNHPVKLLTNDIPGIAGTPRWFWIDKNDIPSGHEYISTYQYVIGSSQRVSHSSLLEQGIILDNNSAHGRSKVSLISLNTHKEIDNFAKYISTDFARKLYVLSLGGGLSFMCSLIPDLEDYTDKNTLIDWEKPLDEQLYDMFDITEQEINLIKEW